MDQEHDGGLTALLRWNKPLGPEEITDARGKRFLLEALWGKSATVLAPEPVAKRGRHEGKKRPASLSGELTCWSLEDFLVQPSLRTLGRGNSSIRAGFGLGSSFSGASKRVGSIEPASRFQPPPRAL